MAVFFISSSVLQCVHVNVTWLLAVCFISSSSQNVVIVSWL
jgi:hypothetical protein